MRKLIILGSFVSLLSSCAITKWENSIHNPRNQEYVIETAFDNGITPKEVTQKQFNERYISK